MGSLKLRRRAGAAAPMVTQASGESSQNTFAFGKSPPLITTGRKAATSSAATMSRAITIAPRNWAHRVSNREVVRVSCAMLIAETMPEAAATTNQCMTPTASAQYPRNVDHGAKPKGSIFPAIRP